MNIQGALLVSTTCGSGWVSDIADPPATAGGTDFSVDNRKHAARILVPTRRRHLASCTPEGDPIEYEQACQVFPCDICVGVDNPVLARALADAFAADNQTANRYNANHAAAADKSDPNRRTTADDCHIASGANICSYRRAAALASALHE